jgi:putative FmdB family regulatory protein
MPIYEYRCASCGFEKDFLQKVSDPVLTDCPECGKATFEKQLTAAGFQLKGNGWYATDFKNNGAKPSADKNKSEKSESGSEKSAPDSEKSASGTDKPAAEKDKPAEKKKEEKSEST